MYKPNFCAACGEQIVRTKWRIWTSRRFCQTCSPRFRKERILAPVVTAAVLFGTGIAAGRLARNSSAALPPPLIVERNNNHTIKDTKEASPPATIKDTASLPVLPGESAPKWNAPPNTNSETVKTKNAAPGERITDPNEIVSICGARTQKGTPCSRRVRGTGRCWQHKGMPAMLPASKLIVQG